jgi:hypothetical protein
MRDVIASAPDDPRRADLLFAEDTKQRSPSVTILLL